MALILKNRVKEETTTTGTGAFALGGASAQFDTFQTYMSNGDTTYYSIAQSTAGTDEWEIGIGTWNTGNTLSRTTVLAGSNGTSAVDFSAGTKEIFMTYPAEKAIFKDGSNNVETGTGKLLIGKSTDSIGTAGTAISSTLGVRAAVDGNIGLLINRLSSDGNLIDLRKDSTQEAVIGFEYTDNLFFKGISHAGMALGGSSLYPSNGDSTTGGDASYDLGTSSYRWRNAYLSGNLAVGGTVDGRDVATDGSKLDGIESGATADQTASEILTAIKTVDGSGSGLDADTLDGAQPSVSASNSTIVQRHSSGYIFANYFNTTANDVSSGVTKIMVETGNDNYIRHGDAAAVRAFLNVANGATANTGDITAVTAGTGLSGGGTSGSVTLNLAAPYTYIDTATANYGTIKVDDDRGVGWAGYGIRDDWTLMSDGASNCGIYNDTDNEWSILCRRNAEVELYYNGALKAETTSGGLSISGNITGPTDIYVADQIIHTGDTDTYMQFHAANQWRVVTGGTERLEVTDGTSLFATHVRLTAGHYFERLNHNSGHLVGSYNSVGANSYKSNPIYTIGSSYNPADASLSNMYGIGYSHTNASFFSLSGQSGWGMYVAADGDARVQFGGSNGAISCTGNITAYASDGRLKTNIETIPNALEKIKSLRGVSYDWVDNITSEYDFHPTKMHELGVIAQEVQEVAPELVMEAPFNSVYTHKTGWSKLQTEMEKELGRKVEKAEAKEKFEAMPLEEREALQEDHKFLTVDYERLSAILIEAIKEQQKQIDELKDRLA